MEILEELKMRRVSARYLQMHNTYLNEELCHLWIQKNDGYAEYL